MNKTWGLAAAGVIAVLVVFGVFGRFFVDLLWFDSLGFRSVFTTVWLAEIAVFAVAAVVSFAILFLNGLAALRATANGPQAPRGFRVLGRNPQGSPELIELS